MADALTVFNVAGAGGINLADTTNYILRSIDLGDDAIDELLFAETSQRMGADVVGVNFRRRTVKIRVFINAAESAIRGLLQTLNRNLALPPRNAEIAYTPNGSSTVSYLDIIAGERAVRQDYDGPVGREYEITIYTQPFWRTVALASPRILQNLVLNPSFERWTGGVPDSWPVLAAFGTGPTQSATWAKYGLSSVYGIGTGAYSSIRQINITTVAETQYAVSVWVNVVSGTMRLVAQMSDSSNVVTVSSSGTGVQKLSTLYTTAAGQTNTYLRVDWMSTAEGYSDGVYLALASNTGTAVPTEWVSYTQDLWNHEDSSPHDNGLYIADLLGDAPALSELRFTCSTLGAAADRIHLALREANAQNHVFQYQAETGTLNAAWVAALFDGGAGASPESTIGSVVQLTAPASPGTKDWAWACRITLSPLSGEASTVWRRRKGRFRVLARVATDATTAANWQLKAALVVGNSTTAYNDPVALALVSTTYHLVDLGEFTIPLGEVADIANINPIRLEIAAKVTTEPNKLLNIDCIYLFDNSLLAQTLLAAGTATWAVDYIVYSTTLEDHQTKAFVTASNNLYGVVLVDQGDPFYLPVFYPLTIDTNYDTHSVLNWLIQRNAGGHILTDRCGLRLSYIPQYLAPAN